MTFKSINPYNNELIEEYPVLSSQLLENKLQRSTKAFHSWKKTSFSERALLFQKVAEILRSNKAHYANIITLEMGKAITEALGE